MSWELNTTLVADLRDRLEAQLPGAIAAINATVTEHELTQPAQILDHIPLPSELTAFPTVGIEDRASRIEDDTGSSATGIHTLAVVVFCHSVDQSALVWALRRYGSAVVAAVTADRSYGDAYLLRVERIDPGPTLGDTEDPRSYMSWRAASFAFMRDEL